MSLVKSNVKTSMRCSSIALQCCTDLKGCTPRNKGWLSVVTCSRRSYAYNHKQSYGMQCWWNAVLVSPESKHVNV